MKPSIECAAMQVARDGSIIASLMMVKSSLMMSESSLMMAESLIMVRENPKNYERGIHTCVSESSLTMAE